MHSAPARAAVALVATALALVVPQTAAPQTRETRAAQVPSPRAPLFPPEDIGLLEVPDRDLWQKPDRIMDALGIADASVVADIGAGGGWFTVRLARRVGPNGRVYAQDVQRAMDTVLGRRIQREGLTQVRRILGTPTDPRLPPGALDAVLMVGVVHEIPDRVAFFRHVRAALRPTGRVGVVDFTEGDGGPGPAAAERVDRALVVREAEAAGLEWVPSESFLPYQYFLIFRPSASATPGDAPRGQPRPARPAPAPRQPPS